MIGETEWSDRKRKVLFQTNEVEGEERESSLVGGEDVKAPGERYPFGKKFIFRSRLNSRIFSK